MSGTDRPRLSVVGSSAYGGVRLRGITAAANLGVPFLETSVLSGWSGSETALLVKYDNGMGRHIRGLTSRLFFDPLDCWLGGKEAVERRRFWQERWNAIRFDDIVATTPAAATCMREALGDSVRIHLASHAPDGRVSRAAHEPAGPVVYCGDARYVAAHAVTIAAACRYLGRDFELHCSDPGWITGLKGAALSLVLWLPPFDGGMNRWCKPQIKLANAARAGVPVLASRYPCVLSSHPEVVVMADEYQAKLDRARSLSVAEWANAIHGALQQRVVPREVRADELESLLRNVLNGLEA